MEVQHFFDKETSTLTYIVFDPMTRDAVIIDPVMDYDNASGVIDDHSVQNLLQFIETHNLLPHFVLETHAHADHLTGAQLFKEYFPQIQVGISKNIIKIQKVFGDLLKLSDFTANGLQFDKLIEDQEIFSAGSLRIKALPTPGHTPACLSFLIGKNLFTGDALFIEDYGTGRCDFPEGSAALLFHSVHSSLYSLPNETTVFVGHDYQPHGRELRFRTTIGVSKKENIHLKETTSQDDYVRFRQERDKTLTAPKLLFPSIQVNIRAGKLPTEEKGQSFLKLPLFNHIKKKL